MVRIFLAVLIATLGGAQQAPTQSTKTPATTSGAITGLILDDNGQPVAGAQVIVDKVDTRNLMQFINTDDAGRFRTSGLLPGHYAMEVHWPGYIMRPDGLQPGIHRAGEHLTFNLIKGGVITGRVTDATGEPVVSADVIARRTHDLEGRKVTSGSEGNRTDDRGVYRIYGLQPGRYVVHVSAGSGVYVGGGETGDETPTYYPSSARDAAVEITVQAGEEVSGIDIRRRGDRGHAITGIVSGDLAVEGAGVILVNASNGAIEKTAVLSKSSRFAFYGVPDGEYDLYARKLYGQGGNAGSALRRVVMKGADLFGVDLKLIRYGSISGRVVIDSAKTGQPAAGCESRQRFHIEEILLDARSDNPTKRRQDQFFDPLEYWGSWRRSVVEQKGEFTIQNLESGLYRLNIDLPGEDYYVRSITRPAAGASKKDTEVSRAGIAIKSGEKLSGFEVLIAEGAASLRGRAVPAHEDKTKNGAGTARLQIHLLPAEESAKDDILRYAETLSAKNGSFEFKHLAPGKYWLLARPAPAAESVEIPSRPVAWNEAERIKLRRDAKKNEIELKPCQRLDDYALKTSLR
jgi:Carboxypeptidase regulatory-like domain